MKVALLEAGRNISPKEFTEHMPAYKLKYRDMSPEIARTRPVQKQCYACMEYNYDWFVDDLKNPYTTPSGKPFTWQRLRIVGGRSLVWGRQSYRMSDLDFKAASHDGYGEDWPLSYKEMEPYYEMVERYVGISGAAEGNPTLPDSHFLPPMKMTCGEIRLRERVQAAVRTDRHDRPHRDSDAKPQRPRRLPLLRAVRTWVFDVFVFQQPVHHGGRRAENQKLYADHQRRRPQRGYG